MATVYSGEVAIGSYNRIRIKCDYSGTSATLTIQFRRTSSYTTTWADSQATLTFNGQSKGAAYSYTGTVGTSWVDLRGSISGYTISTSGGTYNWSFNNSGGVLGCSGSIVIPSQATAPTGLALSNVSSTYNSVTGTVSVTGWGGAGDANTRYRNLSVMATNDKPSSARRYQRVYGNTMSSAILVNNSTDYGTMTIASNTKYWLWWYATNGTYDTMSPETSTTTVYTRPAPLSAKSATVASTTSIKVSYTTAAEGNAYSKKIQYSLDGTNWSDGATVSSGSSTSGNFTITGLTPGTAYTIRLRTTTTAGATSSGNVTATTYKVPNTPTVSASNTNSTSNKVTYGTSSFNTPNSGTVYLYGGTSASPTTQLTTKTSTGNSDYTHSSLVPNTKYYYRARAKNTGGWSSYSSDATIVTRPAAAIISVSSYAKTSITLAWSTAADGGTYTKSIQYSLDSGTTWVNGKTGINGNANSGTFTISNLTAGTSYTIQTRTTTTAGNTTSATITQKTRQSATTPTISKNDAQQTYNKITYGTTSFGYPNTGTVYLYGGTSANPTTQIDSKTTTGNTTFQHSSLVGNTKYYYRSRAKNTGLDEYTSYTADLEIITRPPTPTFAVSSYTSTTITLSYSCPADGGALEKRLQYSLDNQSSWHTGATVTTGDATTGTFTITGLTPDTTYTIYTKVYVGGTPTSVSGNTITQKTLIAGILYGSAKGKARMITKLYGSTFGQDVLPRTFDGTTSAHGITYTLNGRTLTLNGQNDGTGNSVYYLARIGSQPLDLPAGTYRCSIPSNVNVHMTFYDGSSYQQLNSSNDYTTTFDSAGSYSLYVEVNKGNQTVLDNFKYTPVLYDDTGHTITIKKLYGSLEGVTKLLYQG